MLVILFCNIVCVYIYRYVRSSLVVVVFFIVKSESKRSHGTDFAAEVMTWNFERYSCGICALYFKSLHSQQCPL